MAARRKTRSRKKKVLEDNGQASSEQEEVDEPGKNVSARDILQAQVVIQRLQAKYKHKIEEFKENNFPPPTQSIDTSPTKIAKVVSSQSQEGTSSNTTETFSTKEAKGTPKKGKPVHRRVNSRTRRKIPDQQTKPTAAKESTKTTDIDDTPSIQESTPFPSTKTVPEKKDIFGFEIEDSPAPGLHSTPSSAVVDDTRSTFDFPSPQSSKPEVLTEKPRYMKILDFKTPVVEKKTRTRRRNAKCKTNSDHNEEEWINDINKEFAEIDQFDLIIQ